MVMTDGESINKCEFPDKRTAKMIIANEIRCSNCGAPIAFKQGELLATCSYCGFTVVIPTERPFMLKHSMVLPRLTDADARRVLGNWMGTGFLKPSDLLRHSTLKELRLTMLPFWLVPLECESKYKGIFERLGTPEERSGVLSRSYDWLVCARKLEAFPTRDYLLEPGSLVPFDFRILPASAEVLNSEIDETEAIEKAKSKVEELHRTILSDNIDRFLEFSSSFNLHEEVYLHLPFWFETYDYRGGRHLVLVDAASGRVVRGDFPQSPP